MEKEQKKPKITLAYVGKGVLFYLSYVIVPAASMLISVPLLWRVDPVEMASMINDAMGRSDWYIYMAGHFLGMMFVGYFVLFMCVNLLNLVTSIALMVGRWLGFGGRPAVVGGE